MPSANELHTHCMLSKKHEKNCWKVCFADLPLATCWTKRFPYGCSWGQRATSSYKVQDTHPPRTPWSFDTDMRYQCAVGCCRHLRPQGSSRQLLDVWRDSPAGRPGRQAKTRPNFPTVKLHHHWPLLWFHNGAILKSRQSFCSTTFPIMNESLFELISW